MYETLDVTPAAPGTGLARECVHCRVWYVGTAQKPFFGVAHRVGVRQDVDAFSQTGPLRLDEPSSACDVSDDVV